MENIFYLRLKALTHESGNSFNQIERELGYTRNALANYKNGGVPSGIRLMELANYFKVLPDYLIGKVPFENVESIENTFVSLTNKQKIEMYLLCR
ncbi:MAG: helix-turn-helix domain-containing protein [Lactococcus cremoris]|jgi:transcriptional regulator with XRE-family HTH domain|uniref:helix-turn-helix domain-containing protein n=1 Tax=Lactococcus lactis subsp. cremoris TaxID=1359 RepID=UPI002182559E|nr:helix-turn-helix domain-containing protein [Lactococcus cremoris]MCT0451967.1 XRE family transcriptional regulator [Lactococcus cremoris]MDA2879601.1 helix-turn-helix domain-containing protein [Lactococcus cremoris]MDA2882083.1 helix-turn-helix domain-containing protein [Lactococcus cremoris]